MRNCFSFAVFFTLGFGSYAAGENAFPPSPNKPWAPQQLGDYEQQLAAGKAQYESNSVVVPIDPDKVYDLPELIDIAERSHPQTRVAWEQARQAAKSVGLSESTIH